MPYQPEINQELAIDGDSYRIAEHPAAPGIPYGQEGRAGIVYQLVAQDGEKRALKVFKARYRLPALVSLADRIERFADLPGLSVCHRTVLSARRHGDLLRQHPDLTYAVLMPWIEGPTWMEVMGERRELTPEQSLALARSLAEVLAVMEEQGLAHCDLSGPNVLLPGLEGVKGSPSIALVDVEQLYGPGLERSKVLPGGSPGYAHKTAPDGLWAADADRFAGAVLLAEMLGWCDTQVREASWGENYFDPSEMQQDSDRYCLLAGVLRGRWKDRIAALFERAWRSETLADCPAFGEWLVAISPRKEDGTVEQRDAQERLAWASVEKANALMALGQVELALKEIEDAYSLAPELVAEAYVRALVEHGAQREKARDVEKALASYRRALQVAPEGSTVRQEIAMIVDRLEVQLHRAVPQAPAAISKPAAGFEYPTRRAILWLLIMLAGWAGVLGLSRFMAHNEWLGFVGWAAVGALVGLAQWLVARKVTSVKSWWLLVTVVAWTGCWALGREAAGTTQRVWFVEAGRDIDRSVQLNLWWSAVWQLALLLNAVFNGAAVLLLQGRAVDSNPSGVQ